MRAFHSGGRLARAGEPRGGRPAKKKGRPRKRRAREPPRASPPAKKVGPREIRARDFLAHALKRLKRRFPRLLERRFPFCAF